MRRAAAALGGVAVLALAAGCGLLRAPTPVSEGGAPPGAAQHVPGAGLPTAAQRQTVPVSDLIHARSGKFIGLEAQGAPDALNPVQNVAESLNVEPNLIGQYVRWPRPFDALAAGNALSYGALYYVVWEPFGTTVAQVANGNRDAYITSFARAIRAYRHPVAISFGHEMNGYWYPWSTSGATAAEFVAAWRHIHDLFAKAGAGNVVWIWNPNVVNPVPNVPLQPFWPGDAYVDWVGLTGYFAKTGPDTFDALYGPTMQQVRQFTNKPFIIAETSVQTGINEIASIENLVRGVRKNRDVMGFVWFDYNKDNVDWTLESRAKARAAMVTAINGMPLVNVDK